MVRPSGGSIAESEHLTLIDSKLQTDLRIQLQALKATGVQLINLARALQRAGHPALASRLLTAHSKADAQSRKMLANLDANMRKAGIAAEVKARETLEEGRRQNGRDEQPNAFLDRNGGTMGHRERMRDNISVGIESGGAYPIALNIGMLSDLRKAVDRQGAEVYRIIEYGWNSGPGPQKGVFVSAGGPPTKVGESSGQAVFVPGKGRKMTPQHMFEGYHFLEAGRIAAAAGIRAVQAQAIRDASKANSILIKEMQQVKKDLTVANAKARNKARRQGKKP